MQSDDNEDNHSQLSTNPTPDETTHDPIEAKTGTQRTEGDTKHSSDNKTPTSSEWSRLDKLGLAADVTVAIATALGVVFLILQWNQTDEALRVARVANELTAKAQVAEVLRSVEQDRRDERLIAAFEATAGAAKISAVAAQDQVRAVIDSTKAQEAQVRTAQRARVTLTGIDVVRFEAGYPILLKVNFTNIGKTGALNYAQWAEMVVSQTLYKPSRYPDEKNPFTGESMTLEAGRSSFYPLERVIEPMEMRGLREIGSNYIIYVIGAVRYADDGTGKHFLRFCRTIDMRTGIVAICRGTPDQEQ